ncbi:MAG TPA: tRNA dihydrouridine synthase DusB [Steroidobacteraceae bacterium]|nr:tRNA dihydrouridine synthase DusB [Steroidobacteraceae bacterium]
MRIGPFEIAGQVLLAPMAGVTDQPFRQLCRRFGAAVTPAEMLTADSSLWSSRKSRLRRVHQDEPEPRVVQLAGADPQQLAEAARANVAEGAQIIDLNMGCPAKKVCNRLCGSALLSDEPLVARILDAVVRAVPVPVTLKIRTGADATHVNALRIARLAEQSGVQALAIHGRTRAQRFEGVAEYETIREVCQAVGIPVIANGDIASPPQAAAVLHHTGAAAVMIGRAAQGSPWIFRDVNSFLENAQTAPPLLRTQMTAIILQHLESLYAFYGEHTGLRIARKHLGWYCRLHPDANELRQMLMAAGDTVSQHAGARDAFGRWALRQGAAEHGECQGMGDGEHQDIQEWKSSDFDPHAGPRAAAPQPHRTRAA